MRPVARPSTGRGDIAAPARDSSERESRGMVPIPSPRVRAVATILAALIRRHAVRHRKPAYSCPRFLDFHPIGLDVENERPNLALEPAAPEKERRRGSARGRQGGSRPLGM